MTPDVAFACRDVPKRLHISRQSNEYKEPMMMRMYAPRWRHSTEFGRNQDHPPGWGRGRGRTPSPSRPLQERNASPLFFSPPISTPILSQPIYCSSRRAISSTENTSSSSWFGSHPPPHPPIPLPSLSLPPLPPTCSAPPTSASSPLPPRRCFPPRPHAHPHDEPLLDPLQRSTIPPLPPLPPVKISSGSSPRPSPPTGAKIRPRHAAPHHPSPPCPRPPPSSTRCSHTRATTSLVPTTRRTPNGSKPSPRFSNVRVSRTRAGKYTRCWTRTRRIKRRRRLIQIQI